MTNLQAKRRAFFQRVALPALSKQEVLNKWDTGTIGYDAAVITLVRDHGFTEKQADEFLLPWTEARKAA